LALSLSACKSDGGAKSDDAGMQPQSGHTGSAAQGGNGTPVGQSGIGGISAPHAGNGVPPQGGNGVPPQGGNGQSPQGGNMGSMPHARLKFQLQGVK
jgi:23S rRNA pseudouridine2605 synthase